MVRFIEDFSCWHRLETSVARLLRCRDWRTAKTGSHCKEKPPSVVADPLDPLELQTAERAIIKSVEHQYFKGELGSLKSRKPVVKKNPIYFLELFPDEEEILRVGGRLKNATLPEKLSIPLFCQRTITYQGLLQDELMSFKADILERSTYSNSSGRSFGS